VPREVRYLGPESSSSPITFQVLPPNSARREAPAQVTRLLKWRIQCDVSDRELCIQEQGNDPQVVLNTADAFRRSAGIDYTYLKIIRDDQPVSLKEPPQKLYVKDKPLPPPLPGERLPSDFDTRDSIRTTRKLSDLIDLAPGQYSVQAGRRVFYQLEPFKQLPDWESKEVCLNHDWVVTDDVKYIAGPIIWSETTTFSTQ
jgi:hypothetical protein